MAQKKILVLGSGLVAKPCVDYLLRNPDNELTVGRCISAPFLHRLPSIPFMRRGGSLD